MPRGIDAKMHGLLRNIFISPLEGETKFLSELFELRNFREGYNLKNICRHSNADLQLHSEMVQKNKNKDCGTKSAMTGFGENSIILFRGMLRSCFGRSALLCRQGKNYNKLVQHKKELKRIEPSPAFVMLTGVRKRLLPLTKREGIDSVITDNLTDTNHSQLTTHYSPKRKVAFTLAEVLITLGIIGIVSALTMPSLINNFRAKQLENQFKKVDSNLQQAIQKTVTEMGYDKIADFNRGDYTASETATVLPEFKEIFLKQFPDVKEYNCYLYFYKNLPCKTLMGGNEQNFTACCSPYAKTYILPNGFLFQEPTAFRGEIVIYFDINGPYKGPNRTGHDRFTYSSKAYNNTTDTGLYDMCNPNIQNSWNQSGCYRYATRNINPLDSSKPYWDILFKDAKYWKK